MEVGPLSPFVRAHRNEGAPAKQIKLNSAKKTVSVASVFKQHIKKVKQTDLTTQSNPNTPKPIAKDASHSKALSAKSRSSSRTPQKPNSRVSKRRSSMHPFALEFRDASDDYRRHLYQAATLKINTTLGTLIHALHESTLQTVPSNDQQDAETSPLKISAPAKYERMALKLYQPLSGYKLRLQGTNAEGEKVQFHATLEARMTLYEERVAKRKSEIAALQREWEAVVSEIWNLGVSCVGEAAMEETLFTTPDPHEKLSPSKATNAESTLFVPEDGMSTPRKTSIVKKRVTFQAPEGRGEYTVTPTSRFPEFLYQPSRSRVDDVPVVPSLPEREARELADEVETLGREYAEELGIVETDYKQYWKRKAARLAIVMKDED